MLLGQVIGLVAVAVAVVLAGILIAAGLPFPVALAATSFAVGLTLTRIGHARDDGLPGVGRALLAGGYLLLTLLAPIAMAIGLRDAGWEVNGLLLFGGSLVVVLIASLLVRLLVSTGYQVARRVWRARERRRLAATHGWRFRPTDPAVLTHLRHAQERISAGRRATGQERTHAVLEGEANGVAFLAFDYFVARWLSPPEVATAWLVRLPYPLPPFHPRFPNARPPEGTSWTLMDGVLSAAGPDGPEVVLDTGPLTVATSSEGTTVAGAPAGEGDAPTTPAGGSGRRVRLVDAVASGQLRRDDPPADELGRAILTAEVAAHTRHRLPWWWIGGPWLAVATATTRGAPAARLVATVEDLTVLATRLDWSALARHAVPTTGDRTG